MHIKVLGKHEQSAMEQASDTVQASCKTENS